MAGVFRSLGLRNYRIYVGAQLISLTGTWMQVIAQDWLVLEMTDSGVALGSITALQFLPMLLAGPWGGLLADRLDKRRLLVATQTAAGALAFLLGLLTGLDVIELWMVFVLAGALGCITAVDQPTRQTFVFELVGPDHLSNAVALNTVVFNLARVVGPVIAGTIIATAGIPTCFLVNAASYGATVGGLLAMRRSDLRPGAVVARRKRQLRDGIRYALTTPEVRTPLLMLAVISTLTYEFHVSLPLLAKYTFHTDAGGYAVISASMGAGAVVGGLVAAAGVAPDRRGVATAAIAFGVSVAGAAVAPTLPLELGALVFVGAFSMIYVARSNAILQLTATPAMRGRVMSLYGVAFLGSTPIGGPLIGYVAGHWGARSALLLGGVVAVGTGVLGRRPALGGPAPGPDVDQPPLAIEPASG